MKKNTCRMCQGKIEPFLDFGPMPLANGFLKEEKIHQEFFFPLAVAFCKTCCLVQLLEQPPREKMFHAHYPFLTGSSQKMKEHFRQLAEIFRKKWKPSEDRFLVEIGSNDGTFLKNFLTTSIRHLGVEPAKALAEKANQQGIETLNAFFEKEIAEKILKERGSADAVVAANVMCHLPYLDSVLAGIRLLLKPQGIFCFEDPYLGEMLSKNSYDQIYDEHVFIFSVTAIQKLLARYDLEIFDLELLPTHGGSMRFWTGLKGHHPISASVGKQLQAEQDLGWHLPETYELFRKRCENSRQSIRELLEDLKRAGKRVMGYAATSKSTTMINYCKITPDLLEAIADTTPAKQGLLSPGAHIPIISYETFQKHPPDYALLFGWNHQEEIFEKEKLFSKKGGQWIVYVPQVTIKNPQPQGSPYERV